MTRRDLLPTRNTLQLKIISPLMKTGLLFYVIKPGLAAVSSQTPPFNEMDNLKIRPEL